MPVKKNQPALRATIAQLFANAQNANAQNANAQNANAQNANWFGPVSVQARGDKARWPQPQMSSTREVGQGRIESRELRALCLSQLPKGWVAWPGAGQVFCVERRVVEKKTGRVRHEVVYGITSLSRLQADAGELLRLLRGHWRIENGSHWVRDVTFDEDRSCVRKGSTPQVLAALRNTVIGRLKSTGCTNIAAALRFYAAHPWHAFLLLGIMAEN